MSGYPRTEAGRLLAEWLDFVRGKGFAGVPHADAITAIEAEASVIGNTDSVSDEDCLTMDRAHAKLRHPLSNPTSSVSTEGVADGLSEAWAAAEAALPRDALIRAGRTGMTATGWATAYLHGDHLATEFSNEGIASALRALTTRLTAINPDSPVEPDRG